MLDFRMPRGLRADAGISSSDQAAGGGRLELDDLLSFGGDDLGLEVDESGCLVLTEGADFE
ncbi:MAG: hypothetical protein ACFCUW_14510 [Kiloniellaceae bacterium]